MTNAGSVEPFKNRIIIVRMPSQKVEERASYSRKTVESFSLARLPLSPELPITK
jgi:hypothetical protein